ncbi:hypothetical protein GB931_17150 [Modestobacter sp. I12A-02628]|uniref:Uncharacterized protein n=1 Tax=Goekera deserti TaxID=2497753 RepID=A0A7K3WG29_9ACTN|nr:hypothetical protein [Goekera deserti]MPQ99612.1 hypothetical protein [Goekera deserti]NDI46378.1 hypothetical protein [Goekera deserti]NEL54690.1 hypothetical protein [Goekera deserti]
MMVAMMTMCLVSLGLPLLGWWVGGRSMALRVLTRDQAGACSEAVQGCSLTPAQQANVRRAMSSGRRLDDPAERAAVVGWAQATIDRDAARARRRPVAHRALRVALVLWGAAMLVGTVYVVAHSHVEDVPVFPLAWYALFAALTLHHRATLRRVVRNNSDVEVRQPVAA